MHTKPVLFVRDDPIPEGPHRAELVRVYSFSNAYGDRIGFEFRLAGGSAVLHSAAPSRSPQGKLAESLHGLLGRDPTEAELAAPECLVGRSCTIVIRTASNRSGRRYPNVIAITP